jgi:Uracil DNA glycosylase superfamily
MWHLYREAGIDRHRDMTAWNVVPWYLGDRRKIRAAKSADWHQAAEATRELINLLPKLQVVGLLGKPAARAWDELGLDLPAIKAPHPSPENMNTRPEVRGQILRALKQAKQLISTPFTA